MFDPVIAPSGTLLGLLQRGRGDGTLHALAAPRAEALAALNHCVLRDPRHDWQVENRSLYYARLYLDLARRARRDRGAPLRRRRPLRHRGVTHRPRPRRPRPPRLLRQARRARPAAQVRRLRRQLGLGPGRTRPAGRRRRSARPRRARPRPLRRPIPRARPSWPPPSATPSSPGPGGCGPRIPASPSPRACVPLRRPAVSTAGSARCGPAGPRPGWSVQAVFEWAQQGVERGSRAPCARRPLPVRRRRARGPARDPRRRPSDGTDGGPVPPPCATSPTATIPTPST